MNGEQECQARPWQHLIKGEMHTVREGWETTMTGHWRVRISQCNTSINTSFHFMDFCSHHIVPQLSHFVFTQLSLFHHHALYLACVYCSSQSSSGSLDFIMLCLLNSTSLLPVMFLMPIHVFLMINSYHLLQSSGCVILSEIQGLWYLMRVCMALTIIQGLKRIILHCEDFNSIVASFALPMHLILT